VCAHFTEYWFAFITVGFVFGFHKRREIAWQAKSYLISMVLQL